MTKTEKNKINRQKKNNISLTICTAATEKIISKTFGKNMNIETKIKKKGYNTYIVLRQYTHELCIFFFTGGQINIRIASNLFGYKEDLGNIFDFYKFTGDELLDDETEKDIIKYLKAGMKTLINDYFDYDCHISEYRPDVSEIFNRFYEKPT